MQLILRIIGGPAQGRRIVIRRGQVAQVGRTEWADFSISRDQQLADIHFSVEWTANGYRITDLNSESGTFVNGESITNAMLHTGDQLQAGTTVFAVEIEGEPLISAPATSDASREPGVRVEGSDSDSRSGQNAVERCAALPLSEGAQGLLNETFTPRDYLQHLIQAKLFPDAIRVLAFLLPKPIAVQWCAQCVKETLDDDLTPPQRQALETAIAWSHDRTEENRRAAEQGAQQVGTGTPAGWVALAAFWSEGSLAPAGLAEVAPGPALTSRAITAALLMTAPRGKASLTSERYRRFLDLGMSRWEQP